jgi:hypothetical protein
MAWQLVESGVKEHRLVRKSKIPHKSSQIRELFFVEDSAAHNPLLCYPKIMSYLNMSYANNVPTPKSTPVK